MNFNLPFGSETLSVTIPDDLLGEVVSPKQVDTSSDPQLLIQEALANPIGTSKLEDVVTAGQTVAIIVDDITRDTPIRLMLPPVLNSLENAGIFSKDIRVVIALGTHRPMSEGEILRKLGREVVDNYQVVNTPSHKVDEFEYLGESKNGIPAWVNRAVVEADVRIGMGGITPHSDAGFSGGAKIVLPGVCNDVTVNAFHARGASIERNLIGEYQGPMRLDLETFVEDRVGLDFILNAVIDARGDLYRCVAGHFIKAHREGVTFSQELYGVAVDKQYPIVIVNCPSELDLWVCSKGIWMGEPMVCDGGTLILVTPCSEGITNHPLYADYIGGDPDELQAELDSGRAEDPNACAAGIQAARMRRRIGFVLVSPGLDEEIARRMKFDYFDSVEVALEHVLGEQKDPGSVALMTFCDYTIPVVSTPKKAN